MKEEYIRRVGRLLALPGKQKREVLRDLEEIFASGAEHGETEQGVIQRLGTPEEYAAGVELSLGKPRPGGKLAGLVLSCAACVVCFGLFWAAQRLWVPQDAIGFAQGSTSIQVEGAVGPLPCAACPGCGGPGAGSVFPVEAAPRKEGVTDETEAWARCAWRRRCLFFPAVGGVPCP